MDKNTIIKAITETHGEISEQLAVVNAFLKVFNTKGALADIGGIINFFNVSMVRHFMKENIIFDALLKAPGLSADVTGVISDTLKEHDKFMDEFRQLAADAGNIEKGETELSYDFIKKCQYLIWALSKHAQVEDIVIFEEVSKKMNESSFKALENELLKL